MCLRCKLLGFMKGGKIETLQRPVPQNTPSNAWFAHSSEQLITLESVNLGRAKSSNFRVMMVLSEWSHCFGSSLKVKASRNQNPLAVHVMADGSCGSFEKQLLMHIGTNKLTDWIVNRLYESMHVFYMSHVMHKLYLSYNMCMYYVWNKTRTEVKYCLILLRNYSIIHAQHIILMHIELRL